MEYLWLFFISLVPTGTFQYIAVIRMGESVIERGRVRSSLLTSAVLSAAALGRLQRDCSSCSFLHSWWRSRNIRQYRDSSARSPSTAQQHGGFEYFPALLSLTTVLVIFISQYILYTTYVPPASSYPSEKDTVGDSGNVMMSWST